ncbi:hypothetical protein HRI_002526200 [Hibiscus trionum]|uniref:Uncharacterized protein n=1 Tax=Hibiscus trionum TaxID=183268 RepID=A0A9W7I3B0_HIBTR|nr:hypothetical protein HRI_002526200 [Hibiscus trionum]
MEARKIRKRKNADQMPEEEQPKPADFETDRSVDEFESLTTKYRALLAEKTDSDARAERAEKRVKELEGLLKLKDHELADVVEMMNNAYKEVSARCLEVEQIIQLP